MFRYEKDMMPILMEGLSKAYKTDYMVSEFNSGYGIADLVLGKTLKESQNLLLNYEDIYWVIKYINRRNKIIELDSVLKNASLKKKKLLSIFNLLVSNGILEQISDTSFLVLSKYSPPVEKIIAVEAKLSDWKGGMTQAIRYKLYSHHSYLAISEEFVHRVDTEELKRHNIGLISVNTQGINIILKPLLSNPKDKTAYSYLSEHFYSIVGGSHTA